PHIRHPATCCPASCQIGRRGPIHPGIGTQPKRVSLSLEIAGNRIKLQFDANGAITDSTTPAWVNAKILDGVAGSVNPPVNWRDIAAPRLGIFALYTLAARQAWYWYLSTADQELFDAAWPSIVAWYKATIGKFAAGNPVHPLILPGAP